jgi:nicotinate dehydrogenase subunit B
MSAILEHGITRRKLLGGAGALTVAFSLTPANSATPVADPKAVQPPAAPPGPQLVPSLKNWPMLDGWIRIDAQNKVTVFTGKAELGQGIRTALCQVAAEELVVLPARITMVTADTDRTANEGYTAGSHSMQDSGTAIRHAAAQAREILLGLAATKLSVPVEDLTVSDGTIKTAAGASVTYGELVADETLHVEAQPVSKFRDEKQHTIMGKPLARLDIPRKVTGGVAYVQDMKLPGMVHGRVVRPPSPGATLRSLDTAAVEKMPGVLKVVRDGRFLAVIGAREYPTVLAAQALAKAAQWDETETLPDPARLYESILASPPKDIVILDKGTLTGGGARTLKAGYLRPYQLHASIGPSCAVGQLVDGKYTVWTHSQGVFPLRGAIAEMVGQPPETVRCIHTEGSGCYGHNAADDVAGDAALLARAYPGKPVRVQWMREDEFTWEPISPAMVTGVTASLDDKGMITEWQYGVWSNTHNARPGAAGDLIGAQHLETPFKPSPPKPGTQPEGAGDRNAIPLYVIPNTRVTHHFLPVTPIRTSALRGLGAYMNVFSVESFMDELARAAGTDPVEFRLKHLDDQRAKDVIKLATDKFDWKNYKARPGHGRGFAFARYKNLAAYCAMACEVEVRRDTGEIRILRVECAVDSGTAVNHDGIRNQIEGGIVQSSSWTMSEEVTFDKTRITSRDWGGYPILRFPQVPWAVNVSIIDRPGKPFLGSGEASQGPTGAMIANALADATGVRMRQLPLTRERVRTALAG